MTRHAAASAFTTLVLAALLTVCAAGSDVRAGCSARLTVSPPSLDFAYRPFDASPLTADITFRLSDVMSESCDAALAIFTKRKAYAGHSRVNFEVRSASGAPIANPQAEPLHPGGGLILLPFGQGPGEEKQVSAQIRIPAGQIATPGLHIGRLKIALYERGSGRLLDEAGEIPIVIDVAADLRLSLAGGGQGTTLDFGQLADGASRTVLLRARANTGFAVTVSSENEGAMLLDPPSGDGQRWALPYRIAIGGAPLVSLDRARLVPVTSAATELGGMNIPVEVVLGPKPALRAGRYRDVVTISVEPGY